MPTDRYDHSCGLVVDRDRGPEIVAAGGDELSSVDIYTVDTNSWRPGDTSQNKGFSRVGEYLRYSI